MTFFLYIYVITSGSTRVKQVFSYFIQVAGVDLKNYHKINAWFEKCKKKLVGYEEANQIGIDEIKKIVALR